MPLLDAEGALERALGRVAPRTSYAEALAQSSRGYRLRVDRSQTTPTFQPELTGAVFRAWAGQRWAETVAPSVGAEELDRAARALVDVLARGEPNARAPPGPSPTGALEASTHPRRPMSEMALEEQIELARSWFRAATEVPGITNAFASLAHSSDERLFRSTSGARRYQSVERTHGSVVPLAIENGRVEYDAIFEGATGGAEVFDAFTEERIRATARISIELLKAGAAPSGRLTVLLDPSTAGTFAHESFGHGTEADQLLRDRSYLKPLLGRTLGPPELTIVDDGSYPNGWGSIYFDDEGTPGQRTVLVDRGRFVEVLHDRETSAELGRRPTGNARRSDFMSRVFVRMTNTFIEPGDRSFEELLKEAKEGVYLQRATSGIEDPLGGQMQLKVKHARRIEHGELTDRFSSMALSGRVLDFLQKIRGVGRKDAFEMSPGYCGKGHTDLLPAGTGGTYLLSEAIVGPA